MGWDYSNILSFKGFYSRGDPEIFSQGKGVLDNFLTSTYFTEGRYFYGNMYPLDIFLRGGGGIGGGSGPHVPPLDLRNLFVIISTRSDRWLIPRKFKFQYRY